MESGMSEPLNIALRISGDLKAAVEELAMLSGQPAVHIAESALAEYIAWRIPQLKDLQEAIDAADRDEFADDADVAALFTRYGA